MNSDIEKELRAIIFADPTSKTPKCVLCDFLTENGRPEGVGIGELFRAQEMHALVPREKFKHYEQDVTRWRGQGRGFKVIRENWMLDMFERSGQFIKAAIESKNFSQMRQHTKHAYHKMHYGIGPNDRIKRDPSWKELDRSLFFAVKHFDEANKKKDRDQGPRTTIQRRLVDLLRTEFGDKQFTGRRAAELHFQAQLDAGKNPQSSSAARGVADYYYSTGPILQRVANVAVGLGVPWRGSGTLKDVWQLKPNAEQLVDRHMRKKAVPPVTQKENAP